MRIIGDEREFPAIAQRDRYGVQAGNIVEPAAGRYMNPPSRTTNEYESARIREPL